MLSQTPHDDIAWNAPCLVPNKGSHPSCFQPNDRIGHAVDLMETSSGHFGKIKTNQERNIF
jgi:hypothetical protein